MKLFDHRKRENVIIPLFMLFVIITTMILGTVMTWKLTIRRMKDSLHQQISSQADALADKLDSEFALLNGLGTAFTLDDLENLDYILEKLTYCADKSDFMTVNFAYADGKAYRNDGMEMDVSGYEYFKQCLNGEEAVQCISGEGRQTAVRFEIAVPIIFHDHIAGVLIGDYNEEKFRSIFQTVSNGVSEFSYVCDSDGRIVIATRQADQALKLQGLKDENGGNIFTIFREAKFSSGSRQYVEAQMENQSGGEITYTDQGEKSYAMFEPLGINDWYIITVLPESQIYAEAMETVQISYVMLAAVMFAVVCLIAYLLLRERNERLRAKEEAEELNYILAHDELTGVLEEKVFLTEVSKRLVESREGEYCLVYLDVYKFKLVNEMFGYEKGDEFLRVMGKELQRFSDSENGVCGRISGDKFILFLPHRQDIIEEFYTRKEKNPRILPIEVYIHYGVYVITNMEIPVATMVDCAQLAQKAIKGNYDNYVSYYNERLKQKIIREQEIINSMAGALENGEFVIYLQPQYNYRDGSVSGAEVLVRWNSPTKGLIPPGDFIPIFETNGFIIKLDENVWEQACKLLRSWIDRGQEPFPISVNVSRADLLKGSVAEKLKSLIDKYELTADLLRVEITESAYMDNPQQLVMEINKMRDNGFIVEMDDFGSGYSSLNMLKDVPIHVLKTDLKFLDSAGIDKRRDQILDHVIRMAHQIGLTVVAEGVETKEQADYLMKLDCQIMQGYYFSKPVPVKEFEQLVYGTICKTEA